MNKTVAVRTCTDVAEASNYFQKWAISENWDPGLEDVHHIFYPCDPNGFFVGTIEQQEQEKVVSCICAMKPDGIGYICLYIVGDPLDRKKHYGFSVARHALNYVSSCRWIRISAVSAQVESYKRSGFVTEAPIIRFEGGQVESSNIEIPITDLASVPVYQLISIDQRYTGISRPTILTNWIRCHTTEEHCYGVAIVEQKSTVGFGCMRRCESGAYRIAPLYADTVDHAYALVAALTSSVAEKQFITDVYMANPAAESLFTNKLGWKPVPGMMPMCTMWRNNCGDSTDDCPKGDSSGRYSIVSPEVG